MKRIQRKRTKGWRLRQTPSALREAQSGAIHLQ